MAAIEHRPDRPKPWRVRYRAPDGHQRSKSFRRKVDAERWVRAEESKIDRGEWIDAGAGTVTLGEWFGSWLASKRRITERTRSDYQGIYSSRLAAAFGSWPLRRISRDDVSAWAAAMTDEGLSPRRVRKVVVVLAACLEAAVDERLIGRNPARRVELPRLVDPPRVYLTAAEVARLAGATPAAERAMVWVLAYGGLRFGEAAGLRRDRCDLLRRRLVIDQALVDIDGRLGFGPTKTHARRVVQLPEFVAEDLARHLSSHVEPAADALVFGAPGGGPLDYTNYRRRTWNPARVEAGLDDVRPHDLRHTCASLMRAAGATVEGVSQQLGHRSPIVTLTVYSHLFDGALDPVMDRLDDEQRSVVWPRRDPSVTDLDDVRDRNQG